MKSPVGYEKDDCHYYFVRFFHRRSNKTKEPTFDNRVIARPQAVAISRSNVRITVQQQEIAAPLRARKDSGGR